MSSDTVMEIRRTFSIESDDPKEIRKELIKKMALVYPKTGPFLSDDDEKQYYLIYKAIEKIDEEIDTSKALICVDDIRKSLDLIRENGSRKDLVRIEQQKNLEKQIEVSIKNYQSRTFYPKITLATVTGIMSFIWFFPSLLENHPLFKSLLVTQISFSVYYAFFSLFWIMCLIFTAQIWMLTALTENRKNDLYSKLQFEVNQNELFNDFLENGEFLDEKTFLKINFIDFLMNNTERVILGIESSNKISSHNSKSPSFNLFSSIFLFSSPLMESEIADSISDMILTKAVNKKLIRIVGSAGLEDIYSTDTNPS
jgi:hypothetical protein